MPLVKQAGVDGDSLRRQVVGEEKGRDLGAALSIRRTLPFHEGVCERGRVAMSRQTSSSSNHHHYPQVGSLKRAGAKARKGGRTKGKWKVETRNENDDCLAESSCLSSRYASSTLQRRFAPFPLRLTPFRNIFSITLRVSVLISLISLICRSDENDFV